MPDDELREELLALEHRGWDSLCNSTGGAFYGDLMTDEALMVLVNGQVMDREAVVRSLGHAPPWRTYELNDVRLVNISADSAALVYVASAHREPHEEPFDALMSSVYVRRDGRWRLALYQQTRRPDRDA